MFSFVLNLLSLGLVLAAPSTKHDVATLDGRIVGGRDTDIASYPYQISLMYYEYQACGGAIISPNWVVTAAHCVDDNYYSFSDSFAVRAGSSQAESGGQLINISQIIVHPNYNEILDYDIALLKLSEDITVGNASAIALPTVDDGNTTIPGDTIVTITGWGNLEEDYDEIPDTLQVVEIPVVTQEDCKKAYEPSYNVTDRMFCAGILETGGKDSCQGDSGGPVVADGVLVGLVSWGIGCAEPHNPGVYTNVLALRSWIKEIADL